MSGLCLGYVYEPTSIIKCLTAIINFYMALLQSSCKQLLTCKADDKIKCEALMFSPIGVLFREFIHFMIMLQNYAPVITSNCDGLSQLAEILDLYSGLNKEMESSRYMGKNDMNWPLQPGKSAFYKYCALNIKCSLKNLCNLSICLTSCL